MPFAPIRGAPPGTPNPDFPIEEPRAKPAQPTAAPASGDQPPISPIRLRQTPIEIGGSLRTRQHRGVDRATPIVP
jgi:hypothetical protein